MPLSAISWRPVLVVEEAAVSLSLAAASQVHSFFGIYKAGREPTPY